MPSLTIALLSTDQILMISPASLLTVYRILVEQAHDIIYETWLGGFFQFLEMFAAQEILEYSRARLLEMRYTELVATPIMLARV